MVDDDGPKIIECELRLHSGRPANKAPNELIWADWVTTVVGRSVTFQAVANMGNGTWHGPLPPGVQVSPPVALDEPWWTVFLPSGKGIPILSGEVGRPLAIGEPFTLAPGEPGAWTGGVVFDGAIVVE